MSAVVLNIYDIGASNGWLSWLGMGLYHTGVEVCGKEYSFCVEGIVAGKPRSVPYAFREALHMGIVPRGRINEALACLRNDFVSGSYSLPSRNCNHFSEALCQELLGVGLPSYINRAANWGSVFLPSTTSSQASVGHTQSRLVLGRGAISAVADEALNEHPELTDVQRALLSKLGSSKQRKGPKSAQKASSAAEHILRGKLKSGGDPSFSVPPIR